MEEVKHAWFRVWAEKAARVLGRPSAFLAALTLVLLWAVSGPYFRFSDSWQVVISTSTTIITFLMVFLLQSTQKRDSFSVHLKLNELLRAVGDARTSLVSLEKESDTRLDELHDEFVTLADEERSRASLQTVAKGDAFVSTQSRPDAEAYARWMNLALEQAELALLAGEAPIGCVLVDAHGNVVSSAYNTVHSTRNPVAHAEINAFIQGAGRYEENEALTLVSTLEPCVMCVGASSQSGVTRIVFGLNSPANSGQQRVDTQASPSATSPLFVGGVEAKRSTRLFQQWLTLHDNDPTRSAQRDFIAQLLVLTA